MVLASCSQGPSISTKPFLADGAFRGGSTFTLLWPERFGFSCNEDRACFASIGSHGLAKNGMVNGLSTSLNRWESTGRLRSCLSIEKVGAVSAVSTARASEDPG